MSGIADCRHQVPSVGSNLQRVRPEDSKGEWSVVSAWRTRIKENEYAGNSLAGDSEGTRSQMTLTETRISTDSKALGKPHSHLQKISESKMTAGLVVNRRRIGRGGNGGLGVLRWSEWEQIQGCLRAFFHFSPAAERQDNGGNQRP